MKPPLWKKWLSYLTEFEIESTSSTYNPELTVSLTQGRYQLYTENAIYSFADLYDNFSSAFTQLNLDQLNGKDALVLGLGLGSIPVILEKMGKSFNYTAIEVDEEVIYLFSKYTLPQLQSSVQMICADAHTYVMQETRKYDLILVDVFLDDIVPANIESDGYLKMLRSIIAPGGVLLYNRLAYTPNDAENAKKFYQKSFEPVFENGAALEVKGNLMLVSDKKLVRDLSR